MHSVIASGSGEILPNDLTKTERAQPVDFRFQHYALSADTLVRKEAFGCIAMNSIVGRYFQYNCDGFRILSELNRPHTVDTLSDALIKGGYHIETPWLAEFLESARAQRILQVWNAGGGTGRLVRQDGHDLKPDRLAAPAACTIYLTEFCSTSCLHCVTESSPHVSRRADMSVAQWARVLERLRDWGVFSLTVTGGEPLLYRGALDVLREADRLGFNITLLTDFDGMTRDLVSSLKSISRLNDVQTSLDGATAETHDFVRGRGSFEKTLARLRLFQQGGLSYTISTAVFKKNLSELDDIIAIYRRYGAKSLYLNPMTPYGRAKSKMSELLLDDAELRVLALRYYLAVASDGVHSGNAFWQTVSHEAVVGEFHPFEHSLDAMSIGAHVFSVSSNGDCYLDSKAKSEKLLCLGNALTDEFAAMWTDQRLGSLRANFNNGNGAFISHQELLLS